MARGGTEPLEEWAFLGKRVLMVSIFPPAEDGIARYAEQLAATLRRDREVVRLGVPGGGGDCILRLRGGVRALRVLPRARGFDDVLVMYHPHYYIGDGLVSRLAGYAAWSVLAGARRMTFVIHEQDDPRPVELGRRGRAAFWLEERIRSALWQRRIRAVFHTEWERRQFAARFPDRRRRRDLLTTHGSFFRPVATVPRAVARERLGLPQDRAVLLCIGFLSYDKPDKGLDRAIRAVRESGADGLELHIVGSKIREGPDIDRYVAELHRMAAETPNAYLHERFVSDEEFDLWIQAADAVVAPYRTASSSGVIARAHLLGTPLIASGAGGTDEQLRSDDLYVSTDDDLATAMRRIADRRRSASTLTR